MNKKQKVTAKKEKDSKPFFEVPNMLSDNPNRWTNRLLIGTPTVGSMRFEWVQHRFGQTIPCNFSLVDVHNFMSTFAPLGFQITDAENLTAKTVVEGKFKWFLSWEDDNLPPMDALVKINEYMLKEDVPIVSGFYTTRSVPPEPLMYRGMGQSYYADWKLGDKVWVSGIPFGFTLIHGSIIQALWDESPEYVVNGTVTRRVFDNPMETYIDPTTGGWMNSSGTSDLAWCKRIMENKIFEKAGWPEYEGKEFPFLVDTTIFVKHIDRHTGVQYPMSLPQEFLDKKITWKEALKLMTK